MIGSGDTRRRAVLLLVAALVLMTAFSTSYIGAFHDPSPRDVPFAVVAPEGRATQLADRLDALPGSPLDVRVARDRAAALALVRDREVYGAYDAGANRLYVASAANRATATALELTLGRALAAQALPAAAVQDVAPLPDWDPNGTTLFYLVVAWVFGGYFAATVLGLLAGPRSSTRRLAVDRLLGVLAFATLGSLLTMLIARWSFGVLDTDLLATWAAGILVIGASGAATVGLQALAGPAGTGLVILLFVILGNPAAGGPYARPLLPDFWSAIGGLLPPGAGMDLLRGVTAFDGARIGGPIAVLAVWALLGVALTVFHGGRPARSDAETAAEAAAGAAAA